LQLRILLHVLFVLQIQRAVLYDHVKKDVSKWNSVVYHNRLAEQLVFPLEAGKKLPKPTAKDRMEDFVVNSNSVCNY
jgi:U3 small nucleolar RNA-associated protein 14